MRRTTGPLVLGLAPLALALILTGCGGPAEGGTDPHGTTETTSPAAALEVGDCALAPDDGMAPSEVVPCEQPHDAEVFHRVVMPGDEFDPAALDQASLECVGAPFTDFIGVPREQSSLLVLPVIPTPETWSAGDRVVSCLVVDEAGPVRGTLRGSAR